MQWFPATERGFALGVRQTAIPVGGLISALVLPTLSLRSAFVFLGVLCLAGAAFGVAAIRDRKGGVEDDVLEPRGLGATLRDHRLWLLCAGSSFYLVAQLALISFMVLFLHDERGFSDGAAAGVLGGSAGRRGGDADRRRALVRPASARACARCGLVGVASAVTLAVASAVLSAPLALLLPAFVLAGGISMAWNGPLVHGRRRDRRPEPQRRSARDAAERPGRGGRDRPAGLCRGGRRELVADRVRRCSRLPARRRPAAAAAPGLGCGRAGSGAARPAVRDRRRDPPRVHTRGGSGSRAGGRVDARGRPDGRPRRGRQPLRPPRRGARLGRFPPRHGPERRQVRRRAWGGRRDRGCGATLGSAARGRRVPGRGVGADGGPATVGASAGVPGGAHRAGSGAGAAWRAARHRDRDRGPSPRQRYLRGSRLPRGHDAHGRAVGRARAGRRVCPPRSGQRAGRELSRRSARWRSRAVRRTWCRGG